MTRLLRSALLADVPGLVHGHTTRVHGSLGAGCGAARDALLVELGADPGMLVVPHQVHGAAVTVCDATHAGAGRAGRPAIAACDGLATDEPGLTLFAQGADCPLLLLAPRAGGAVAVVHSGWRGTVARIGAAAVDALRSLGHDPASLVAAVFPGIGPCCFEVGPEVVDAFREVFDSAAAGWARPPAVGRPSDRRRLDLRAALRHTLRDAGLADDAIDDVPGCTVCDGRLWSHRASGGAPERHALAAHITTH